MAMKAWHILCGIAVQDLCITYRYLGSKMYEGRLDMGHTVSQQLKLIEAYCDAVDLPRLNLIVMNESEGAYRPGNIRDVYDVDWLDVVPPTIEELEALRPNIE